MQNPEATAIEPASQSGTRFVRGEPSGKILVLCLACCFLGACQSQPKVVAEKSLVSAQYKQASDHSLPFKAEGDFANGNSIGDVLNDMTVRDTLKQLVDKRSAKIDLKHLSEYTDRPTRDDLMIFKSRDCSFVRMMDLSGAGVNDSDLESISDLKLTQLTVKNNDLKDLHALKNMQSLIYLDVSGCPIDKSGVKVIGGLRNLANASLDGTPIDDRDLAFLGQSKSLRFYRISSCPKLTAQAVRNFKARFPLCFVLQAQPTGGTGFTDIMRVQSSLMNDGEYDEADLSLQGLIKKWQAQSPVPYSWIVRAYRYRARCQAKLNRPQAACHLYDTCLDICAKNTPDNPERPDVQVDYAVLLEDLGRLNDAKTQRAVADQFWKKHPSVTNMAVGYRLNLAWLSKHQ